jgi:hypothetical protein
MSSTTLHSSRAFFRATLKISIFAVSLFAAIFCASAGYGLLKMLLSAMSGAKNIGLAEFSTHSGLTIVFLVLAGISAYVAKKCVC